MSKKVYVDLSQQDVQDIINAYEKDIEKFNKQKEVLDKIKEYINNYELITGYYYCEDEFENPDCEKDFELKKELQEILEEVE